MAKKSTSGTKGKPARKKATSAVKKTASKKKTTAKKTAKKTATRKKAVKSTAKKTAAGKKTVEAATARSPKSRSKKSASTSATRKTPAALALAQLAMANKADKNGYVFIKGRRVRLLSTDGTVSKKKKPVLQDTIAEEAMAKSSKKVIKSRLSAGIIRKYRKVLLEKRLELLADMGAIESAALQMGGDNLSKLPVHMADLGSDVYIQDLNLNLAEGEGKRLKEIHSALQRIKDGTYGVCAFSGDPIPTTRLDAKPWAKFTIEVAQRVEHGWTPEE